MIGLAVGIALSRYGLPALEALWDKVKAKLGK
jgi:hypothetical protein